MFNTFIEKNGGRNKLSPVRAGTVLSSARKSELLDTAEQEALDALWRAAHFHDYLALTTRIGGAQLVRSGGERDQGLGGRIFFGGPVRPVPEKIGARQ